MKYDKNRFSTKFISRSTYNNKSSSGPSQGHIDLVFVCYKSQILLTPAKSWVLFNTVLWQRASSAENHVVPFPTLVKQ